MAKKGIILNNKKPREFFSEDIEYLKKMEAARHDETNGFMKNNNIVFDFVLPGDLSKQIILVNGNENTFFNNYIIQAINSMKDEIIKHAYELEAKEYDSILKMAKIEAKKLLLNE